MTIFEAAYYLVLFYIALVPVCGYGFAKILMRGKS